MCVALSVEKSVYFFHSFERMVVFWVCTISNATATIELQRIFVRANEHDVAQFGAL